MANRKLPVNQDEAGRVKKKLRKARNNTERVRIEIMVKYFKWKNSREVSEGLWISKSTVQNAIDKYIELWIDEFYKTKHKGRPESKRSIEAKQKIKKMIKEKKGEIDINDVKRELNKDWSEFGYRTIWWLVRKQLECNYQKPFVTNSKQSEYAKEIAEGRLRKAVIEVWIEERKVDAKSVKNKKTKFSEFMS